MPKKSFTTDNSGFSEQIQPSHLRPSTEKCQITTRQANTYYDPVTRASAQPEPVKGFSPTFAVGRIPVDRGVAALAFTLRFSIPVFALGVFSTNESLRAEVVT